MASNLQYAHGRGHHLSGYAPPWVLGLLFAERGRLSVTCCNLKGQHSLATLVSCPFWLQPAPLSLPILQSRPTTIGGSYWQMETTPWSIWQIKCHNKSLLTFAISNMKRKKFRGKSKIIISYTFLFGMKKFHKFHKGKTTFGTDWNILYWTTILLSFDEKNEAEFFGSQKKSSTKHYLTWHTLTKPPRFTTSASAAEIKTHVLHEILWLYTNFKFPVCIIIVYVNGY